MIFQRVLIRFIFCFLATLLGTAPAYAKSAREIAQNAFPSTVLLVMKDSQGEPAAIASGFFVTENVIATNLHAIKGAQAGYAKPVGQETQYEIAGILGVDVQLDLALLSVENTKAPFLTVGESNQIAIGDEIYVIGNPLGLEGTFSKGIVSSIRHLQKNKIFQITAPISPGSSGGPVLDLNGKVIGVATATIQDGQNLNFAIPAGYLKSLMGKKRTLMTLAAGSQQAADSELAGSGRPMSYLIALFKLQPILLNFYSEQVGAIKEIRYFSDEARRAYDSQIQKYEVALDHAKASSETELLKTMNLLDDPEFIQTFILDAGHDMASISLLLDVYPLINSQLDYVYISMLDKKIQNFVYNFREGRELIQDRMKLIRDKRHYDFATDYSQKIYGVALALENWRREIQPLLKDTGEGIASGDFLRRKMSEISGKSKAQS